MSLESPGNPGISSISKTSRGRAAEEVACRWLEAEGWTVVVRNWRRGPGELDIVAAKAGELAFVEVKAVDAYGLESLARSVGRIKRSRIVETSKLFIAEHREFRGMNVRYDVAAVRGTVVALYLERAFPERS
ncbi:MAG: YraN family protein [Spirochaetia bacterium]|nr:YraN family protein [Spirochaetia bacterium]